MFRVKSHGTMKRFDRFFKAACVLLYEDQARLRFARLMFAKLTMPVYSSEQGIIFCLKEHCVNLTMRR
jgi:hypothetical protein